MQVSALKDEKEKVKEPQSRRVTPSLDTHFRCRVGNVTQGAYRMSSFIFSLKITKFVVFIFLTFDLLDNLLTL